MVNLLHRQAVRAKAEGLFFQVSRRRPPLVSPSANWAPAFVLNARLGIHPEPVQDHPRGSKIFPQRSVVQGSGSANQLRTPSILQSRRGGLLCPRRGALPTPLFLSHSLVIEGPSDFSCAQAFFPKNRNRWKKYSSWESESKTKTKEADARFPPDVQVKKGFMWSEQLAIAMAALQEAGQSELIEWVKEVCLSRAGKCPETSGY